MAKKEYPPEIKELETLKGINTRLSSHCSLYCIEDGIIYMKSNNSFMEKFGVIDDETYRLHFYNRCMITVPQMRSFLAKYKKTKVSVIQMPDTIHLTMGEDDLEGTVILLPHSLEQRMNVYKGLYTKFLNDEKYYTVLSSHDNESFYDVCEDNITAIKKGKSVLLTAGDDVFIWVAKGLFGDMKQTTAIRYKEIKTLCEPLYNKHYFLFDQFEPFGLHIYTLVACIC